ncbi:MAG: type IV pilus twitching motility protein PilT [Oscillospiraceae bacterium]|nr:type IV pilus twitching motility protein PilT [Oscillospiraceae bacterium]
MLTFHDLIGTAIENGASDLHLSVGVPPCMRINGAIVRMKDIEVLAPKDIEDIALGIMDERHREVLDTAGEVDFAYSISSLGRFRVNVFRQRGSYSMVTRILNLRIPAPEELGIPEAVVEITGKRRGLVLVTGATGSGKSTTLASLINLINQKYSDHIITLEDPIEYLHKHNRSIVNQREMGTDSLSYSAALRAALRQDPDVILVGEMRDLETIATAVTAAETGHLVFSTLHTNGAANTIDRIIDVFPPHQQQQIRTQLADVLQCVISQQLLPRKDGRGRVAAFEVMLANNAIRNHIREAKTYQIPTVMQTSGKLGMKTMDDALYDLYNKGMVSEEIALLYAQDRSILAKRFL